MLYLRASRLCASGNPMLRPTPGQRSGPVLVHQLHDTSATLRLSGVQLLQGLFPLGDDIADLEAAERKVRKAPDAGKEVQAARGSGRAAGQLSDCAPGGG